MIYLRCGDAGMRESEPYDPQGDRHKAARYAAIQRNLWGKNNLPPRGRPGEALVLSHVMNHRPLDRSHHTCTQVWRIRTPYPAMSIRCT